ncbi:DUF4917 family protein [Bacillus sp. OV166]|uniref:DUF4917 family protein n=1 Tax=Bacillus sp. OV166 TaxID=1882763 RepID=UPI0015C51FDD|nr:DUF4917 family protein [Bacillus sp. OV166]
MLTGNGLSISINQNFSYQTLLAECKSLEDENHERVLSDEDLNFFEQFETFDFERVLFALNTSKIVNNIVGLETGEIEKRYEHIKNALVKVVRKVHPSWDEFEDSKFQFLNEYLQKFQGIFTTNYDLILYWSLMRNIEPFLDFFFRGEFDTTNVDVFVNINLSQSDHFKSEPLHSELFPNLEGDWECRVSCPSGQDTLHSSRAQTTGRSHPFVSYFV